jgi:hypothetical protein
VSLSIALALVLGLPMDAALAQSVHSTHWTGWYGIYKVEAYGGQMHWNHMSNFTNQVDRHYWRGTRTSSDYTGWHVRVSGYSSGSSRATNVYNYPAASNTYYGPYTNFGNFNYVNGHVDHKYQTANPSVLHTFYTACSTNTCSSFFSRRRVEINGQNQWRFVASSGY